MNIFHVMSKFALLELLFICFLSTQFFVVGIAQAAPPSKEISFWNDSEEQSGLKIDYSSWNIILEKYVITDHVSGLNRFDYDAVSNEDIQALDKFVDYMEGMDPRQLTKLRQQAYWLNMFNAGVIQQILKSRPSSSIRELGRGLWRSKRFYITMQDVSLDDIEHGILRPIFNDPRVHFSLVAGTLGSAEILPSAYTAENVTERLKQSTIEFLAHSRGLRIEGGRLTLSKIFSWYKKDFGGNLGAIKEFISPYVPDSIKPALVNIDQVSYQYDWTLNKP